MEDELARITGQRCKLRVELAPEAETPSPPSKTDEGTFSRPRGRRAEVPPDAVTKRALDVLEAHVLQRDDDFGKTASSSDAEPMTRNGEG
jgi:hypothetical protein